MNIDELRLLTKNEIPQVAKRLNPSSIHFLVQTLEEKDDTVRYHTFLLLQENSRQFPFTYQY
ncbi:MAG: hypothetical protein QG670_2534 [Thermoproteota archaeon]|nr:hypothetical protein [Thermoproteota archaeon]